MFADGSAAHIACCEQTELERLGAAAKRAADSPQAQKDEAEFLPRDMPML